MYNYFNNLELNLKLRRGWETAIHAMISAFLSRLVREQMAS